MQIREYSALPDEAKLIRREVFIDEQGFEDEFDSIDKTATHIVLFDGQTPAGVCRVFTDPDTARLTVGRVAVRKSFRGRGFGTELMKAAHSFAARSGAEEIWLHSQEQAVGFYASLGYEPVGELDYEEGCPHRWMRKRI